MKQLIELNALPKQQYIVVNEDGSQFVLLLEYIDNQQGWFFSIKYNNLTILNKRLTNSYNVLSPWRNILPFGLQVLTNDFTDPFDINDFANDRVIVYLLTASEVKEFENIVYS